MPTARLIDINTAAITYRTKVLMALDKRLYKNCIGGIKTLNSELPPDDGEFVYRIIFDTEEYNKIVNSSFKIECPKCEVENEYDAVQFIEMNVPVQESLYSFEKKMKVWTCLKCQTLNKLSQSKVIENSIQKPFYTRYVPEPPVNNHGLLSNLEFHSKFVEWVWICLENLEDGFTRFRDDNWNRGEQNYGEEMAHLDTSTEEKE